MSGPTSSHKECQLWTSCHRINEMILNSQNILLKSNYIWYNPKSIVLLLILIGTALIYVFSWKNNKTFTIFQLKKMHKQMVLSRAIY